MKNSSEILRMYIGTYTHAPFGHTGSDEGIFLYDLDLETGQMNRAGAARAGINPSFLALTHDGNTLYSVNETDQFDGMPGGGVSAFHIAEATGELELINYQSSHGEMPCHICLDEVNGFSWVANYDSGSLSIYPLEPGGRLGPARTVILHSGKSIVGGRQDSAHAHNVLLAPQGEYALVADLGMDQVLVYRLDPVYSGSHTSVRFKVLLPEGSGPRHLVFHPNGKWVYLSNELNSTVSVLEYFPEDGHLEIIQHHSTLPDGVQGENYPAEIQVHPSGRFLYVSNRGHDSIAIFHIDPDSGRVSAAGHADTLGRWPRHFTIEPGGRIFLVANQESGTVYTFWIRPETGELTPTGHRISIPTPSCIRLSDPVTGE